MRKRLRLSIAATTVFAFLFLLSSSIFAEEPKSYVTVMGGYTFSGKLDELKGLQSNNQTYGDLELGTSTAFGLKTGRCLFWGLGIELEALTTSPNIKGQKFYTYSGKALVATQNIEADMRIGTFSLNLLKYFSKGNFQPYIGAGAGYYVAYINNLLIDGSPPNRNSNTDGALGLQGQIGGRYIIKSKWAVNVEYKYQHANFDFEDLAWEATYRANNFLVGLSYLF